MTTNRPQRFVRPPDADPNRPATPQERAAWRRFIARLVQRKNRERREAQGGGG